MLTLNQLQNKPVLKSIPTMPRALQIARAFQRKMKTCKRANTQYSVRDLKKMCVMRWDVGGNSLTNVCTVERYLAEHDMWQGTGVKVELVCVML